MLIIKGKIVFIIIIVFSYSYPIHAIELDEKLCRDYNLGSNWYCNSKATTQSEVMPKLEQVLSSHYLPEEKIEILNKTWSKRVKRAVFTHNREDIIEALKIQQFLINSSVGYGKKAHQIAEALPELQTTDSYYKNISTEIINESKNNQILVKARNSYALVFIYLADCSYCAHQLPILLQLKEKYGFKLLGVTAGDKLYEQMDENIIDIELSKNIKNLSFPTIMLLDTKKHKRLFVSKGLTTYDLLIKRIINAIAGNEVKDEES